MFAQIRCPTFEPPKQIDLNRLISFGFVFNQEQCKSAPDSDLAAMLLSSEELPSDDAAYR